VGEAVADSAVVVSAAAADLVVSAAAVSAAAEQEEVFREARGRMQPSETIDNPILKDMVDDLVKTLGDRLQSIVLYGSAARGDFQKATSDFNLFVVLDDLEPSTLDRLSPVVSRWIGKKQPFPRFFSRELLENSTDVFPIEFMEIKTHRVILHGPDPLEDIVVQTDHLRLWCERELREKMMRLREAYMAAKGKPKNVRRLLIESYSIFLAIFRGCLHLLGGNIPAHHEEVVDAFCARAELDEKPFDTILRLRGGEKMDIDPIALFSRYYGELTKAVERVDRFAVHKT
jgi:predicted nucleotidyltransferase